MKRILYVCLLALTTVATSLAAQVNPYKDGTPGVTGYRSEVLAEVMVQEDKFLRLAEAIPADKYIWRPAPDVRSFAEVFLHVSAANFNLYKIVGTPPPATVDIKTLEKSTTDKAKVRDAIEATKGFIGTGGKVNMSATDHLGLDLSAFNMLEIKNGDWTIAK